MKLTEFKKLIREEVRKVLKEGVTKAQLKAMKATAGYVREEGVTVEIPSFWPSYIVQDVEVVPFEQGVREVLEFAKDFASPEEMKKLSTKLNGLKTKGSTFVLYAFESDLSLGVL